jgi:hypothetical protein
LCIRSPIVKILILNCFFIQLGDIERSYWWNSNYLNNVGGFSRTSRHFHRKKWFRWDSYYNLSVHSKSRRKILIVNRLLIQLGDIEWSNWWNSNSSVNVGSFGRTSRHFNRNNDSDETIITICLCIRSLIVKIMIPKCLSVQLGDIKRSDRWNSNCQSTSVVLVELHDTFIVTMISMRLLLQSVCASGVWS